MKSSLLPREIQLYCQSLIPNGLSGRMDICQLDAFIAVNPTFNKRFNKKPLKVFSNQLVDNIRPYKCGLRLHFVRAFGQTAVEH